MFLCYTLTMFYIVGLGNPDNEYKDTRHNTGRIILDLIRKKFEFDDFEFDKKTNSQISEGKIGKEKVVLLKPETFMNKSGTAIKSLVTSKAKAKNLVVIYDDLDLPIGKIKISFNRGTGGHKGVESIFKQVKTLEFIRFRIGISPQTSNGKTKKPSGEEKVMKFILGKFKEEEMKDLKKVGKIVAEALEVLIDKDLSQAMCLANQS